MDDTVEQLLMKQADKTLLPLGVVMHRCRECLLGLAGSTCKLSCTSTGLDVCVAIAPSRLLPREGCPRAARKRAHAPTMCGFVLMLSGQ